MKLTEAKKLLIETLREKKGVYYMLGWLSNSYLAPQDDDTEKDIVTKTLAEYGINVEIEL